MLYFTIPAINRQFSIKHKKKEMEQFFYQNVKSRLESLGNIVKIFLHLKILKLPSRKLSSS